MRRFLMVIFVFVSLIADAQILKERRVYYLDCSYSMVGLGLWDEVRDNLKTAIDNINDETTELIVIPFADNSLENPVLKPIVAYATAEGKKMLKDRISNLQTNPKTMTYHYIPLNDFFNNRVSKNRVTYMFLMTDGLDEDKQEKAKRVLLPQWGNRYGNKNVFGFYVMLHDSAKDSQVEYVINGQEHLWKVETADVNINLIRLQTNAIFNARNDQYFDLPIYGDIKGMKIDAQFDGAIPYKVKKVELKGRALRVWVNIDKGASLPVSLNTILHLKLKGGGNYDFLVTENIAVKCEYKPERSLKISVR